MALSAVGAVGVDFGAAEPLGPTELSDGCGLPEVTGPDVGAVPVRLAALDPGADTLAPPEIGALEGGAEMIADEDEDVDDAVAFGVPVVVELHPVSSRPAVAAHIRGVRITEAIMREL